MTARPDPDLFGERDIFGLPVLGGPIADSVLAGLGKLAAAPPIWGGQPEWSELVDRLRAFSLRWHSPASAAGWSELELYGLDPDAPRARLSRAGGAILACLHNHRVVGVDPDAIRLVTRTSARLAAYRPEAGGVLAWELCASESRRQSVDRDGPTR